MLGKSAILTSIGVWQSVSIAPHLLMAYLN